MLGRAVGGDRLGAVRAADDHVQALDLVHHRAACLGDVVANDVVPPPLVAVGLLRARERGGVRAAFELGRGAVVHREGELEALGELAGIELGVAVRDAEVAVLHA